VTGRGKTAIEDHFDVSFELEQTLEAKGKKDLLAIVRSVSDMIDVSYVRQKEALGLGHAVLRAKELVGNEPFSVVLSDDVIESEIPCIRQLLDVYEFYGASVVALMDTIDSLGNVFREFASAQEAAIEASAGTERMRGLFLASMSHDLKGPLNAILGFAQLVSRNPLSAGQQESLAIIEQRGRELLTLIQTILDSARVEARALRVSPELTMVGDVVMSAVLDARELAVGSNVEVAGEIQPGVPRLFVDGARIVQALTAIISTAVRFTEQGVVRVRATLPAGSESLRIDVETQGRTTASAERGKVFEAFKDADRARRHGSLGLGLSLARSILEIHGGNVQVDMTPGGGCLFHVHLPTSQQRVQMALSIAFGMAPEDAPTLGSPAARLHG